MRYVTLGRTDLTVSEFGFVAGQVVTYALFRVQKSVC